MPAPQEGKEVAGRQPREDMKITAYMSFPFSFPLSPLRSLYTNPMHCFLPSLSASEDAVTTYKSKQPSLCRHALSVTKDFSFRAAMRARARLAVMTRDRDGTCRKQALQDYSLSPK